jgi:uncharacterized protein YpuA (DUF1002 family)
LKTTHIKPTLQLTNSDRDDKDVMIAKAHSVAIENNMDWDKIYNQVKDAHEDCPILLKLSKYFKIT